MTAAILVPRRADNGERDRLWTFARARWAEHLPDWPIIEGHHDGGPFNRSAAINTAAALAGDWRAAVVIDSDVLADPVAIRSSVTTALATDQPVLAFSERIHLNAKGTAAAMAGSRGSWRKPEYVERTFRNSCSGAFVVSRRLWDAVGGFDELFVGWGWEDVAFRLAAETLAPGPLITLKSTLWHLHHARSPERETRSPTFAANRARGDLYKSARGKPAAMVELLAEAGHALGPIPSSSTSDDASCGSGSYPSPRARADGSIPRILHRTVPAKTTDEVEGFWRHALELHPDYEAKTYRDPLDPADWPETGDLWPLCSSGAQRAGLIRLEALWRDGGIYLDSDVELYRPLDPLLAVEGFAGWEDAKVVPDAVLGARPRHPAVAIMLELARREIGAKAGAWRSGPGVTTAVLPGRTDWLLLPPGSFYPYHYSERHRRHEDHATAHPYAFGAHHWHHSWKGK